MRPYPGVCHLIPLLCLFVAPGYAGPAPKPEVDPTHIDPPGDCTKERHGALSAVVEHFCTFRPRSCKKEVLYTCAELRVRWAYNVLCRSARRTIMDLCFRGGDRKHKEVLREVDEVQEECESKMRKQGCPVPSEEEAGGLCQ